jgi:hypothetical protein
MNKQLACHLHKMDDERDTALHNRRNKENTPEYPSSTRTMHTGMAVYSKSWSPFTHVGQRSSSKAGQSWWMQL